MNPNLNRELYALLSKSGLMAHKEDIVAGFSGGRSTSTKDLSDQEAALMIDYLRRVATEQDPCNKMRRKIISMSHELHWLEEGSQKVDMSKVNDWCIKYGYLHKKLNDYNYDELPKLVFQFENMYSDFIKRI